MKRFLRQLLHPRSCPTGSRRAGLLGVLLALVAALPILAVAQGGAGGGSGSMVIPCGNILGPNCILLTINDSKSQGGFPSQAAAQQWASNQNNVIGLATQILEGYANRYSCNTCLNGVACDKFGEYDGGSQVTISQSGGSWQVTVTLNGFFVVCCGGCNGDPI